MKDIIDMAKDRGAFICQSQSMNLWIEDPDFLRNFLSHLYLCGSGIYEWRFGLGLGI